MNGTLAIGRSILLSSGQRIKTVYRNEPNAGNPQFAEPININYLLCRAAAMTNVPFLRLARFCDEKTSTS